jgi:predicted Ser/Thr protein kinase/tetratricopeptide (TPR) repeat protein
MEAVQLGLISDTQLQKIVLELRKSAPKGAKELPSIGDALVARGLISLQQLDAIRRKPGEIPICLGKYQIIRELGRGGMGVVYEAKDGDLGRRVALKMLLGPRSTDTKENKLEEETRFIREARVTATLPKHPNIVGIYETGILQGQRYIAMEYIDGKQLTEWRKHTTSPLRHQVAVLRDATLAVDHAHRHGIIHRDLKPANILVDTKGHPHVTDFGLAKSGDPETANTLTAAGMVMGTPAYMSPEQAQGRRNIDRRTDVWSLGVILYELLTGRQPFRGETPLDTVLKVVNDDLVPPSSARGSTAPLFDKGIENICLKTLAKNPRDRYTTAKAFADDLTHWIKGEQVTVEPPKPDRSKLYTNWAVAAGVIAAVLVGVWMFYPAAPSAAELEAKREIRSQELVTQGQKLLAQGKHADALVAFGRALAENPSNRAAAAGKKEAEQKLVAAASAKAAPAPVAPPAPAPAPKATSAEETARKAREAQEAERLRNQTVSNELAELDVLVKGLREEESFGTARELLDQAAKRHADQDWAESIGDRQNFLKKAVEELYPSLRDQALDARRRGNSAAVDALRARVARWKWAGVQESLDDAIAKAAPSPTPAARPGSDAPPAPAGAELAPLKGHRTGVCAAAISPDGKLVLTSSFDETVRLWDVSGRKERTKLLEGGAFAKAVAFSRDGKWMAAGLSDGTISIWDSSKQAARSFMAHENQVSGIEFSPDSKLLASASTDGSARLWDVPTNLLKAKMEGHPKGAMSLAFSPDGKLLAVGSADPLVKIWKVGSDRDFRTLEGYHDGAILALAFSPDSRVLASGGSDSKVIFWELDSGRRRSFDGHSGAVRGLAFAPDGRWFASASLDGTLRIWDVASGSVKVSFSDEGKFYGTVCSRKGDLLAGCSGAGTLRLWDTQFLDAPKSPTPGK